jgi:hypothetical protein
MRMKVSGFYEESYIQVNFSGVERRKLHQYEDFRLFVSLPVKTMAIIPALRRSTDYHFSQKARQKALPNSSKLKSSSSEIISAFTITC